MSDHDEELIERAAIAVYDVQGRELNWKYASPYQQEEARNLAIAALKAAGFGKMTPFTAPNTDDTHFKQRYMEGQASAPVVTDAMVERAAKAVERMTTAAGYGWTDEQFAIWWNKDPLFVEQRKTCAWFSGTKKEKLFAETRTALEAALADAAPAPPVAAVAVQAEVVGKVRQRRGVHGDFDGFEVDWLLEGGIHAVGIDGDTYLYVLDIPVPDDGHIELFAHPAADDKGAGSGEGAK